MPERRPPRPPTPAPDGRGGHRLSYSRRCPLCGADYEVGGVERAGHATPDARAGGTPSPARPDLPGRLPTLWCRSCGGEHARDSFAGPAMVADIDG